MQDQGREFAIPKAMGNLDHEVDLLETVTKELINRTSMITTPIESMKLEASVSSGSTPNVQMAEQLTLLHVRIHSQVKELESILHRLEI